jgi:hypothetical protein
MHRRITRTAVACALLAASGGCAQVLGLDPPRRDPCADGECFEDFDASADFPPEPKPTPGGPVDKPDAARPVDASPARDAGSPDWAPPPRMIRCGGEGTPLSYCNQSTQTCCAFVEEGVGLKFTCIDQTTKCPGLPISCARQADCDTQSVCCATDSIQSCVSRGTCAVYVCDPASAADCPTGTRCERFANPDDPYYTCR